MKKWYAVLLSKDDNDWGTGSFNKKEAAKMVRAERKRGNEEAYIAVIDVTSGDEHAICIGEIHDVRYI
ncbi:MAG: hypothetical protein ACI3ZQ_05865 [Candidatus Cryptobacteroides sp.]